MLEGLQEAEEAMLKRVGNLGWIPSQLQDRVTAEGHDRSLVALAFWQLANEGRLALDSLLFVRRVDA